MTKRWFYDCKYFMCYSVNRHTVVMLSTMVLTRYLKCCNVCQYDDFNICPLKIVKQWVSHAFTSSLTHFFSVCLSMHVSVCRSIQSHSVTYPPVCVCTSKCDIWKTKLTFKYIKICVIFSALLTKLSELPSHLKKKNQTFVTKMLI